MAIEELEGDGEEYEESLDEFEDLGGFEGLLSDRDFGFGARVDDGNTVTVKPTGTTALTAEQKAAAEAERLRTEQIFKQAHAQVDAQTAIRTAEQKAAAEAARAEAEEMGASPEETEQMVQNAKVQAAIKHQSLNTAPVAAQTVTKPPGGATIIRPASDPYKTYRTATTTQQVVAQERAVQEQNKVVMEADVPADGQTYYYDPEVEELRVQAPVAVPGENCDFFCQVGRFFDGIRASATNAMLDAKKMLGLK